MQTAAFVLTDQFSDLLHRLPAGLDLDRLALETKAIQRKRELVDGASLLRIALARGPSGLSLRQISAWASMLGIAKLSNPGVKYRLNQATAFLAALVKQLLAAKVPNSDLRWPGRILRLADSTCVSKPSSTGTNWRVHGVFDLGRCGFSHLELTDAQGAEAFARGAPCQGEIRIGDRNYARAPASTLPRGERWQGRLHRAAGLERAVTDQTGGQAIQSEWLSAMPAARLGPA